jgi:acylphosphatase
VFSGPAETVAAVIEACRRGPALARVSEIDQREAPPDALASCRPGETFSVLPTE